MTVMVNWQISLLAVLSLLHLGLAIRPAIVENIVDEVRPVDTTARLNCTVALFDNSVDNVQWYKKVDGGDDKTISTGTKIAGQNPQLHGDMRKYEVQILPGRSSFIPNMGYAKLQIFSLIIRRVTSMDAGTYFCKIFIPGESRSPQVYVNLIIPREPYINPASVTQNQVVEEGANITLFCEAVAQPDPRISWIRANGKPLNVPGQPQRVYGSQFTLTNVTRDDRGVYRCHANNNVGYGATHDVRLEVNYAPSVRAARLYGMYLQAPDRNFEITLECISSGFPDPEVSFYIGNVDPLHSLPDPQLIKNTNDYAIERLRSQGAVGTDVNEFFYTLRIKHVRSTHFGNYTCVAKNKYGVDAARLVLFREEICQGPLCGGTGGTAACSVLLASPAVLLLAAAAAAVTALRL